MINVVFPKANTSESCWKCGPKEGRWDKEAPIINAGMDKELQFDSKSCRKSYFAGQSVHASWTPSANFKNFMKKLWKIFLNFFTIDVGLKGTISKNSIFVENWTKISIPISWKFDYFDFEDCDFDRPLTDYSLSEATNTFSFLN